MLIDLVACSWLCFLCVLVVLLLVLLLWFVLVGDCAWTALVLCGLRFRFSVVCEVGLGLRCDLMVWV